MEKNLVFNIERLAKLQGMTLKDIGKQAGVGENAIYRWNKMPPKIATLKKVADQLKVDYKLLLP